MNNCNLLFSVLHSFLSEPQLATYGWTSHCNKRSRLYTAISMEKIKKCAVNLIEQIIEELDMYQNQDKHKEPGLYILRLNSAHSRRTLINSKPKIDSATFSFILKVCLCTNISFPEIIYNHMGKLQVRFSSAMGRA